MGSSRCRRHTTDLSATVGVCASCLRERLVVVAAAQAKAQKQAADASERLNFPRSVSPYVASRKSDASAARQFPSGHIDRDAACGRWFFGTPQVGPAGSVALEDGEKRRSRRTKLASLFSGFFRSKPGSRSSEEVSWLSSVFATRRMKQRKDEALSVGDGAVTTAARLNNRGMSPTRCTSDCDDGDRSGGESSESSSWRQRRSNTPADNPATRRRRAAAASACRNGPSGLVFCLSPLVRASPPNHRYWSQELTIGPPHSSDAASFCKSRSRKLADFGRYNSYSGKCNR